VIFAFSSAISSVAKSCDRRPTEISAPKSINPHPFRVVFKGNVDFYIPETTYTGKLKLNNYSLLLLFIKSIKNIRKQLHRE